MAVKWARVTDMPRFMVWVSAVASAPWIGLSLLVEGTAADLQAVRELNLAGVGAGSPWRGYPRSAASPCGGADRPLRRTDDRPVLPDGPLFGGAAAAAWLGEPVESGDVIGGVLVFGGVTLGLVGRDRSPWVVFGTPRRTCTRQRRGPGV